DIGVEVWVMYKGDESPPRKEKGKTKGIVLPSPESFLKPDCDLTAIEFLTKSLA
ncbi:hypothetical protein H0H93_013347, partial [Arthromyces matolae]